ncbi:hypothetical protein DL93DRAFT_2090071 [Clavulina sp. PMI_390]|nr:hypothetical protein DL93DRAFT_2090071 [Clavulina sp. PMI_390]
MPQPNPAALNRYRSVTGASSNSSGSQRDLSLATLSLQMPTPSATLRPGPAASPYAGPGLSPSFPTPSPLATPGAGPSNAPYVHPYVAAHMRHPSGDADAESITLSMMSSEPPASIAAPTANTIPRWTLDGEGFAEPTMSPTEADKVVSSRQPPGWQTGRIQMIGKGLFMGKAGSSSSGGGFKSLFGGGKKKKNEPPAQPGVHTGFGASGSTLPSGTMVRDGMRIYVDTRVMRKLNIKTGDSCAYT